MVEDICCLDGCMSIAEGFPGVGDCLACFGVACFGDVEVPFVVYRGSP